MREQRVLKKLAPFASRSGDVLVLSLKNGHQARFESMDGCAGGADYCLSYRLLGLSPDRQFFVIESLAYETATRFWVARSSGNKYEVYADTHSSPDGVHIIVANPTECCGTAGVFLWEVKGDRLIEKFRHEPADYPLYSFARWSGAHTVELKQIARADKALCPSVEMMETTARLTRKNGTWTLDERIDPAKVRCE